MSTKVWVGLIVVLLGALAWNYNSNEADRRESERETEEFNRNLANANAEIARTVPPTPVTVVSYKHWLEDGGQLSWAIQPGSYTVHMTASDDGATLAWVGAACEQAPRETAVFNATCTVTAPAQLIVSNPCSLCAGKATSVSLIVTRP